MQDHTVAKSAFVNKITDIYRNIVSIHPYIFIGSLACMYKASISTSVGYKPCKIEIQMMLRIQILRISSFLFLFFLGVSDHPQKPDHCQNPLSKQSAENPVLGIIEI